MVISSLKIKGMAVHFRVCRVLLNSSILKRKIGIVSTVMATSIVHYYELTTLIDYVGIVFINLVSKLNLKEV